MSRLAQPAPAFSIARRFRTHAAWLIAALAGLPSSPGAEPNVHVRTWTIDDGLPHNSVNDVLQDATGFLWFATVGGLARFDGREFREMHPPAEYRAMGFNIRGFAEERPGTLVVVPADRMLLRLTGSTWTPHPASAVLSETPDVPLSVHVDPQGNVWVATTTGRVVRWSPDGRHKVSALSESAGTRTRRMTFASDPGGGTWICGDALWYADREGEMTRHAPIAAPVRLIGTGRKGRIWLWTDQELLQLERGRVIDSSDAPTRADFGSVRDLFEDRSGAVWIASSRSGLFCFHQGEVHRVAEYSSASSITEDREGNIWVATDGGGAGQLREKSYRVLNRQGGLPQDVVSAVCEDPAGRVWLANRAGGLFSVGADGRPQSTGLRGIRTFANVVYADLQNRLWFGGGRNGLLRWEPGQAAPVQLPMPRADLHVLFRARNGDMWFAADPRDLGYYRGDEGRLFSDADGFPPQEIRAIAQDAIGDFWVGGRNGELLRWNGAKFERFDLPHSFPRAPIHAIYADPAGPLWIGTAAGLVLKEGQQFHLLTEADGLADHIIVGLVDDGQGALWFATRRGLFYAAKSDLLTVARGERRRVESHRLGANQGLIAVTPTGNYQPTACRSRDGLLWFATAQGAVVVDPARLPRDLPPPVVLIDEVRFDGVALDRSKPLRIPSGRHRVEFRLAALSFTDPTSVVLQHQLEGVDRQWVDTGVERVASYTNLPPDDYRLRVIARNSAGRWNTEGATLAITVVPAWWERFGVRFGAAALLTALTAWLARTIAQRRLRQRLLRLEQEHAMEKERVRIARDLHDDLGASLTELGLLADRVAQLPSPQIGPHVATLAARTRRLGTELSRIVWAMSPRNSTLDRLAEFLLQYAHQCFSCTAIRCIVKGGDGLPPRPIAPDWQHQLIAATKEALNNLLKHSHATQAVVEIGWLEDDIFAIDIADDGRGFSTTGVAEMDGNGLRNIRARMEEIGGAVTIESAPGRGTRVSLRAPLHPPDAS